MHMRVGLGQIGLSGLDDGDQLPTDLHKGIFSKEIK